MQIIKCFGNLFEESATYALFDLPVSALLLHILVQRDTLNEVGHYTYLFASLYQIVHSDDIGVIYLFQGHDFALNSFPLHAIIQFGFLIYLYCELLHCCFVVANVDYSISSLADWFANLIIVKVAVTLSSTAGT